MTLSKAMLISAAALLAACGHRNTPLMDAAARGDLPQVEALIAAGGAVNEPNGGGFTPLIAAARAGQIGAIDLLLRRGAKPDLRGGVNDWTPVMHALHKGQTRAALALLDRGADPNARTRNGLTALIMAAGYGDAVMVRALLERGADPYAEMADGGTALSAAVGGVPDIDKFTVGDCQTDTVKTLLEHAPDLKITDNVQGRFARAAAQWGNCSEVMGLLARR